MQFSSHYRRLLISFQPSWHKLSEPHLYSTKSLFFNTFKLIIDYSIAIPILMLAVPLMMMIAVCIRLTSQGPILFKRQVLGKNGRPFIGYKFRTMVVDGDDLLTAKHQAQLRTQFKIKDDPRITPLGRFLRRYSLDELPQLFNVLKRDMSLIGPRMLTEEELSRFGHYAVFLMSVKPGISGLWQVNGRSDTTIEERLYLNLKYIFHWSPGLEFTIILQTIPAVVTGRGAY